MKFAAVVSLFFALFGLSMGLKHGNHKDFTDLKTHANYLFMADAMATKIDSKLWKNARRCAWKMSKLLILNKKLNLIAKFFLVSFDQLEGSIPYNI